MSQATFPSASARAPRAQPLAYGRPPRYVTATVTGSASIDDVLRARFGLDAFRPWQREAIEGLLGSPGRAFRDGRTCPARGRARR